MGQPAQNPCTGCDARCCRVYTVHVTGEDAWRLARGLRRPMREFLAYGPQAVPSELGFRLEAGGPTHDLVLGRSSDDPRSPCAFLRADPDGAARCGAYPLRPLACRRFPAFPEGGRVVARPDAVCSPHAWSAERMARVSWRAAVERERRDREVYAVVARAWNDGVEAGASPRTVLDYLDHLEGVYGWLTRWRAALRPRERSGPAFLDRVRDVLRELAG